MDLRSLYSQPKRLSSRSIRSLSHGNRSVGRVGNAPPANDLDKETLVALKFVPHTLKIIISIHDF